MWPEVETAKSESRRELVLTGEPTRSRIEKEDGQLDGNIFELSAVNFLEISGTGLKTLDPRIGQLEALLSLVLHTNNLKSLPTSLGQLAKLTLLNVSGNNLETVPDEIFGITSLMQLDLSQNALTTVQDVSKLVDLHELRIFSNKLTSLPEGVTSLENLHTISASHNLMGALPEDLDSMPHLKELTVADNQLTDIPLNLSQCGKLRFLDVRQNKVKDRRLAKVANQDTNLAKPMLTYLKPLYEKQMKSQGGKKGKGKKQGVTAAAEAEDEEIEDLVDKLEILHCASEKALGVVVRLNAQVLEVRPHILCCVLRNLNFTRSPHSYKHFISLQTRLHDGICAKRLAATIATHNLKHIKSPLTYDARDPTQTKLIPLGRGKEISATEFMKKLQKEAEEQRKQKKRNTVSGIHKYLDLLKKFSAYPFLIDGEEKVISFPPITNCEVTKISEETTDMLIEVTSSKSLAVCREVMEQLLNETLQLGVGSLMTGAENSSGDAERKTLVVEQVRITDLDGQMKNVYPSRVDLVDTPYLVIRE